MCNSILQISSRMQETWIGTVDVCRQLDAFCPTDLKSVQCPMSAFQEFSMTTGLVANYNKSKIVIRGCKPHREQEILYATGFSAGTLPLRYLGIPITASRYSKMECRSMVDKITAKTKTWSTRNLSYAGRAALIQLVLSLIHI